MAMMRTPLLISVFSLYCYGIVSGDTGRRVNDFYPAILREEAVARLHEVGKISDASDYLERTFMSQASVRAGNLIYKWMEDAGLKTWVDDLGNIHGRAEGMDASNGVLLIGSHMDTVIDAGIFDGSLGIIAAIAAVKVLNLNGKLESLIRPVEVIAFSDEEGVRFQSTFLGSSAIAGALSASALLISDKRGITLQDALGDRSIELTEEKLIHMKYDPVSVWGYIEVHIEQGPVLDSLGIPLGVVLGIAGQTRLKVTVRGSQGHAGTVPMSMRQDPMTAAAELIVLLEDLCNTINSDSQSSSSLLCTIGEIYAWPGASNVIPNQVVFTIDIRSAHDIQRVAVIREFTSRMNATCGKRGVSCILERKHDAEAIVCDEELKSRLRYSAEVAIQKLTGQSGAIVPEVTSGAGHDAMAMSHLTKVGMLFVRCRGGISHSPLEYVNDGDVWAAGMAVLAFLETLV